jgi:hypothetical protein
VPDILDPLKAAMVPEEDDDADGDVFVKEENEVDGSEEPKTPDTAEELPIEIRSLTERQAFAIFFLYQF